MQLTPLRSSPHRDVRLQLLAQLSCTQTQGHAPPVPRIPVRVMTAPVRPHCLSPGPLSPLGKAGLPFMSCLRTIVGHKPYTQLLCGFLFASLAFQVRELPRQEESSGVRCPRTLSRQQDPTNVPVSSSQVMQGIFAFFCTHAAGLAGKFQHLVLIMLVSGSQPFPLGG